VRAARLNDANRRKGIICIILSAVLFGLSTPLAKPLVGMISPLLLAGLLYIGSAFGAAILGLVASKAMSFRETSLRREDAPWLLGDVTFGTILALPLVLTGLRSIPASDASLLLNFESVFTILIAWAIFREHLSQKFAVGAFAIFMGSLLIAWNGLVSLSNFRGALAIVVGCLFWGLDNNFIRRISVRNPFQIASIRGLATGIVSILLSLLYSNPWTIQYVLVGLMIGVVSYGFSIVLFVLALRHLGGARVGAYASSAPFMGALFSILLLHEPVTIFLVAASLAMGLGVLVLATEQFSI